MLDEEKDTSIKEVDMKMIMLYGIIHELYVAQEYNDDFVMGKLEELYYYLDDLIYPYKDTDDDIKDIQCFIKLTYKNEKN